MNEPPMVHHVQMRRIAIGLLLGGWCIAYIDRFNVGFAALQMNHDLGLSPAQFGIGAGLFFLTYSALEVPSNILLTKFGPRLWLGRIMITWGVVNALMVFVSGPVSFYTFRLLLGAAEAGFFPGVAFYISGFVPLRERSQVLAKFAFVTQAATVIGGPLAAALLSLNGVAGRTGWQWLFLFEGAPAVVLGACVLRWLPEMTSKEDSDTDGADTVPRVIRLIVHEWRYWAWAAIFFVYNVGSSALRLWQPTMLRSLSDASDSMIAIMSIVPASVAAIAILGAGYSAKRTGDRRWHIVVALVCGAVGLLLVSVANSALECLVAASLASVAVTCQPPLFASVTSMSAGTTRATAVAFVNSIGMYGSFFGPAIVGVVRESSGSFANAYAMLAIGLLAGGILAAVVRERTDRIPLLEQQPA